MLEPAKDPVELLRQISRAYVLLSHAEELPDGPREASVKHARDSLARLVHAIPAVVEAPH